MVDKIKFDKFGCRGKCDICGKKEKFLVDYFASICLECKGKYVGSCMGLIRRIGQLMNRIEELENPDGVKGRDFDVINLEVESYE